MDKPRCQAILLMPSARHWNMRAGTEIRCKYSVKEGNFCGVHKKLGNYISSIVWKDLNGS